VNFRTGYLRDVGLIETRHTKIALHYLRGWLLFDIVSILPFDAILSSSGLSALRLFKSARCASAIERVRPALLRIQPNPCLAHAPSCAQADQVCQGAAPAADFQDAAPAEAATADEEPAILHLEEHDQPGLLCHGDAAARPLVCVPLLLHGHLQFQRHRGMGDRDHTGRARPKIRPLHRSRVLGVPDHDDGALKRWEGRNGGGGQQTQVLLQPGPLTSTPSTPCQVGYGDISASSTPERIVSIVSMALGISAFTFFMSATSTILNNMSKEDLRIEQRKMVCACLLLRRPVSPHATAHPGTPTDD